MATSQLRGAGLYQAVWRWHFFAGLLVLPFLVMMATTGGLYLFKDEITNAVYRDWLVVPVKPSAPAPLSAVIATAEKTLDGKVLQINPPGQPDRSVSMIVRLPDGSAASAYADPYDGHILGSTEYRGLMQIVRKIHSLQRFGFWASCIIEIVAGWVIILVGTGFYLWWPRGTRGGVISVRGKPASRVFWRDVHAVTGSVMGLVILLLAATGMAWSLFWGVQLQTWVGMHGLYAPRAPAYTQREEMMGMKMPGAPPTPAVRTSSPEVTAELPWGLQKAAPPSSGMPRMAGMPGMEGAQASVAGAALPSIGIDRAFATFRKLGVAGSFGLALPIGPTGVYVANIRKMKVRDERTIYLDQYTGQVRGDVRFSDWYAGGKAIEWSTIVHMGREFRPWNRLLMLLACVATIMMSVASVTMWWKRRPTGKLGMPPYPKDARIVRGFVIIMVIAGVIFPLVGASLIVALIIETAIVWRTIRGRRETMRAQT